MAFKEMVGKEGTDPSAELIVPAKPSGYANVKRTLNLRRKVVRKFHHDFLP